MLIIQEKVTQVQRVEYQDVPVVRKVQRTSEVPPIPWVDRLVVAPALTTNQVDKFADVPVQRIVVVLWVQ